MSIRPGTTVTKDPGASLIYTFDWSDWLVGAATIATSTFTISGGDSVAAPAGTLTKDNPSIVSGSLSTQIRLIGGTVGKTYILTNTVITNESPTQTDERSILVAIRNQ